jgi:hypothetical protein
MVLDSVITAVLTVIIGVTVYALSQMASKLLIEPIHKLDEMRGQIAYSLEFYANIYTNPGVGTPTQRAKVANIFRRQAGLLMSRAHMIRWYKFFSYGLVPKIENVKKAFSNLIGLSNHVSLGSNSPIPLIQIVEEVEEIKVLLSLRTK